MRLKTEKDYLLGILFFSALWGTSETALGGALYRAHVPHASVPLTIIGFMILSISKVYFPRRGSATAIASIAALYKLTAMLYRLLAQNHPCYACHLLAILVLGVSYDLVFSIFRVKNKAFLGVVSTYLGYTLFAFTITYVFRYHYWIEEGLPRIFRYVGVGGTMASAGNAVFVPLSFLLGEKLRARTRVFFEMKPVFATGTVSLVTLVLWILGVARCF